MTIWLIGGTQESAELAQSIVHLGLPCTVTVTTESARSLYPYTPTLKIWVGMLNVDRTDQIKEFLQANRISCILDASHPFAIEISKLAIVTAEHYKIPYLRFERAVPTSLHPYREVGKTALPIHLDSFPTLLAANYLTGHQVLLTIGYKNLGLFQPWHDRATLFARILPSTIALEAALKAGFTADRLVALRPPVSAELEKALWQQWNISMVVTKASGTAGGEDIKRQLAAELGVQLVIIDRPPLSYPQQTNNLQSALLFCQQNLQR